MEESVATVLTALTGESTIVSLEDCRPTVHGVSVKFEEGVEDYEAATDILSTRLGNVVEVQEYSNMTGEGEPQVIILIELESVEKSA